MRYGMGAVIALLVVALAVCAMLSRKSKRTMAPSVAKLIGALVMPVTGNLVIILSGDRTLSILGYFTYFLGMNLVMFTMLGFTFRYCHMPRPSQGMKWLAYGLLIADAAQLLCNPIFHHAFDTEAIQVAGAAYYRLIPYAGQTFHRVVCYGIFLAIVGIFFWKMVTAPRLYLERYAVIFLSMVVVGIWETFYIFSRSPIDRSMIGFGCFGLLVYYFAVYYKPVRLLDRMLANVASQMLQGVFFFDAGGRCVWVNRAGRETFHIDRDNFEPSAELLTEIFGDISGEEWVRHEAIMDGSERKYYQLEKHSIQDSRGRTAGAFLSIMDETERHLAAEKDRYDATHDSLTGLYSREYLYERIRKTVDANPDRTYMICFLDINDFKMVNDVFGREFGDYALKCVADSLRRDLGPECLYGRLSGDTFGMCIPKENFAPEIAVAALSRFTISRDGAEFHLIIHQGVYEVAERNIEVPDMFDRASMALESIKDEYNVQLAVYDDAMRDGALWAQRIAGELPEAIRTGQLRPYLQAIVNEKGRVVGAEALARWIHPTEGFLAPYRFIPTLEKNGMIAQVDRHMWRCACEILTKWKDNDLFISINVSPKDFYFMDVVKELTGLVREYGVEPARLRVEITETVMMTDEAKRIEILKALREAGFIVEMDDFGSGYSSLNMLKDMPVDVVKIDMAFLRKTEDDARARTILSSIMQMTNSLKLSSISEGVETAEQFMNLRDMGCGMFQGYYFAKPMAVEDFMGLLDKSCAPA
ncbi:MAG: EAL domain-containing protein [Clostridia bacterium]|nr:EAL domain-containing protein [Clostridia bacterium]